MDEKWFKNRQREVGVTADDIAKKIGRARSGVSQIYKGERKMSADWAKAFAEALEVPVAEILERAGEYSKSETQAMMPGFAESDVTPFVGKSGSETDQNDKIATMMGARPGIDVWRVKSNALAFAGYVEGDSILVDTHKSELCRAGDVVVAQVYNWQSGAAETVLRHYQPPALIAVPGAGQAPRVDLVDGNNVVIRGKVVASWRSTDG
ncbi:MAG: helix-turn-helix transcriptional regulator [Pseudomonadota bacterium]